MSATSSAYIVENESAAAKGLKPGPAIPVISVADKETHKRNRSRYYEAEVHSSEATVEEEDLPSARLDKTDRDRAQSSPGRKSAISNERNTTLHIDRFNSSPRRD